MKRNPVSGGRVLVLLTLTLLLCGFGRPAAAQSITVERDQDWESKSLLLPFAFYNANLGLAGAVAYVSNGVVQKQVSIAATATYGTSASGAAFLIASNLQLRPFERLFLDPWISVSSFEDQDSYIDGNPAFGPEVAGSNDSDEDDFLESDVDDSFAYLRFKYLLPLGHGRDTVINTYVLDRGLLQEGATGGARWNPLKTGRSYVEIQPFYRTQRLETKSQGTRRLRTNGMRCALRYDNTDYAQNPSRGSEQSVSVSRDWGKGSSSGPWTSVEVASSHYFDLGATDRLRQRVLAVSIWGAYSPTYDSGFTRKHRPPRFAGATLGGLFRMRAFPAARFFDQAAIYYTAELRLVPEANPVGKGSLLEFLEIDWLQVVPFIEVGRVAETAQFQKLHSSMQWDAGIGLRAMAKRLVLRIDVAVSDEDSGVQMMIQHPF